ncbi:MAG: hypothetical protein M1603_02035 [Candidatus Marsarchaeota archaeon]|nr:hypothetical protein [Candidatus Marsarchaeota archaeon]
MNNKVLYYALVLSIMLGISYTAAHGASPVTGSCNIAINSSGTNYTISPAPGCTYYNITYESNVANSNVYCGGANLNSSSVILLDGSNHNDRIYNCSVDNPEIKLNSDAALDIIGSNKPTFHTVFAGDNSNVTVGYFLTINIYEPKGFNSTKVWGDQLTHYSYILPTMNNTLPINNTQLQMATSFSPYIQNRIQLLKKISPFGVYNETNSTIYLSPHPITESYGTIYGSKTYILPSYTVNASSTKYYGPYDVEYSFFAYDQLIMFKVNITSNLNITPLYIQPIYPPFNFRYVPAASKGPFTIQWLLSVPPQDSNWTFNYHIYRYNSMEGFTVNPFNTSIGPYASFVDLLSFPPAGYSQPRNVSKTYIFNYTSNLGLGLNSSITIANGTAYGGRVSYIQDSTTPSFSRGIGYCSSIFNETAPFNKINQSGYYYMVGGYLRPLGGPALPILYTAPCSIGSYIEGDNITIICNDSIINDTGIGMEIMNSKNVNIMYCDVKGNGIYIYNSSNVSISNTKFMPGLVNDSGIYLNNSNGTKFVNVQVYGGFKVPFNEIRSNNTNFYNLSSNNASTIQYIQNLTTVYGSFVSTNQSIQTTTPTSSQKPGLNFTQRDYLYIGAAVIVAIYIYLFFRIQYRPSRSGARSGRSAASAKKTATRKGTREIEHVKGKRRKRAVK